MLIPKEPSSCDTLQTSLASIQGNPTSDHNANRITDGKRTGTSCILYRELLLRQGELLKARKSNALGDFACSGEPVQSEQGLSKYVIAQFCCGTLIFLVTSLLLGTHGTSIGKYLPLQASSPIPCVQRGSNSCIVPDSTRDTPSSRGTPRLSIKGSVIISDETKLTRHSVRRIPSKQQYWKKQQHQQSTVNKEHISDGHRDGSSNGRLLLA